MTSEYEQVISPEERGLAAMTHLSGLAGYIIPFGGLLVPFIILMVKSDSLVISAIARQALLFNTSCPRMIFGRFSSRIPSFGKRNAKRLHGIPMRSQENAAGANSNFILTPTGSSSFAPTTGVPAMTYVKALSAKDFMNCFQPFPVPAG